MKTGPAMAGPAGSRAMPLRNVLKQMKFEKY